MRTLTATIVCSFILLSASGQNQLHLAQNFLNGFWIAEEYSNSFEKTSSALLSKDAFDPTDPVAFRITYDESESQILKIDHYSLHDHRIFSETTDTRSLSNHSGLLTNYFTVDLSKTDTLNYHPTSDIFHFGSEGTTFFSWELVPDTVVILHSSASDGQKNIRYKRMHASIDSKDKYINPIYCFTRSTTLVGTYILLDNKDKILAKQFTINHDGTTSGYPELLSKRLYFSTDIYCGEEPIYDTVLICENVKNEVDCDNLIYKREDKKAILLFEIDWDAESLGGPGILKYKMVRE